MTRMFRRSPAWDPALLALVASAIGAGCGGNVVCDPGACSEEDGTGHGVSGEGGAPTNGGSAGGVSPGSGNGGSGGGTITGAGGAPITGPAIVYPYHLGEDLQVVRLSTETLDCAKLNYGMSIDDCDWWALSIGIPAESFGPGSFALDFGTFVSYEAAAANPDCIIQTGGGLVDSNNAVLSILEVTESSVSVELVGVSTEDLNGHDANGAYTALRCDAP